MALLRLFPLFLALFLMCDSASAAIVVRAAFDIGSSTTRVRVAKVDTDTQKVVENLFPTDKSHASRLKVNYKEALQKNGKGILDDAILAEGINALKVLKANTTPFAPTEFSATATAAFREAKNGKQAALRIEKETGIPVHILSQNEEAESGFIGVAARTDVPRSDLVVWDVGAGSMQITAFDPADKGRGRFVAYTGTVASEPTRNHISERLQKKAADASPNPIGEKFTAAALAWVKEEAVKVPDTFRKRIAKPSTKLVGIGGVHAFSLPPQVATADARSYDIGMVIKALDARRDLTDDKVGGQYAATDVSNLILIRGFMEVMSARKVEVMDVNMTDGVLPNPRFWTTRKKSQLTSAKNPSGEAPRKEQ